MCDEVLHFSRAQKSKPMYFKHKLTGFCNIKIEWLVVLVEKFLRD